ncbi:hypothetical protein [Tepidibacter thalassicus]|uniref:Uncharacterized protein n=1 Tax=Tepidibacter thalassicus DSM 15285 TaxID=1123350 RepID=A0A1M5SF04_9FIRM|nr:hypothetical protein [Tepidibacter thalassicus]SHH37000.1 hypothetical protein SAMN02744040_01742 [Tepidibacter thalassicus DSM 15285]
MSIDFVIAKNIDEGKKIDTSVQLEEYISDFLWKNRSILESDIDILIKIDPYNHKLFTHKEIKKLLIESEFLLKKETIAFLENEFTKQNVNKDEFIKFAIDLKNMCELALKTNKTIVSIAD